MYRFKNFSLCSVAMLALLGSMMVGCSSDSPELSAGGETPAPNPSQVTLTFDSEDEAPQGRASVDEGSIGESGTVLRWDAGDKVTMWMGDSKTPCTFETQKGGLTTASFTYTGEEVDTKTYFGFYPAQTGASTDLTLSIPANGEVRQKVDNDSKHLAPYRAMYAQTVTRPEASKVLTGVCFKPLTSLVVFKIANQTPENIVYNSVSLAVKGGVNPVFYDKATYQAGSDQTQVTVDEAAKEAAMRLSLGEENAGISATPGHTLMAFMPLFPSASLMDVPLQIEVATGYGDIVKPFPSNILQKIGKFESGKVYVFNVKQTETGLVIESTIISEWEDGGTIVVPID